MKYNLTKKDDGSFVAEISITSSEWEDANNSAYEKNKGKYSVAGFRKGHAPRSVIEQNYGPTAFVNEALDEVYYKSYTQILREHNEVKPIDSPKLDIKKFDKDGLEMVLTIPCVPDFELATYKGLTFEKKVEEVDAKAVEEQINRELMRSSRLVESKAPAKLDDTVTLDFEGFIDGKAFEGGKAENYQLKLGSHSFIDTFEDQLVGLNVGDKKDVNVTFPSDYHEESLKGKPATFKVEIKQIRERIMPKLDEEFVKNSTEFETVEDYKKDVKEKLTKQAQDRAELELDNDMLDKLIDDTSLTVPETLVDQEVDRQINGMKQQLSYQGIKFEDYLKYLGKSEDEFKGEVKTQSARTVKARLVLEKLINSENLNITDKDIDKRVQEMAKEANQDEKEFRKQVNNDMVNRIANELLMKKIVDFLRANNTIK